MRTRNVLAAAALAVAAALARADDLGEKLESKLAQDFVRNADWVTGYEEALGKAKEEGKLVFAYFTRSYYP